MWQPNILTVTPGKVNELRKACENIYSHANAHVYLCKEAAEAPSLAYSLAGRLVGAKSDWLILEVPSALVRGAFDALHEPGVEYPPPFSEYDTYRPHISVMRPEELKQLGGIDKITERGHFFHYTLGPVKTCTPAGWGEMSKVWFIECRSPELTQLRKSYGLSGLPHDGEFKFHITIGVRRRKVLHENEVSKAASDSPYGEDCPVCGQPATSRCRCMIGNMNCDNGHSWHHCPVHKTVNPGTGHGTGGGCTCNQKEAADLLPTAPLPEPDPELVIDRPKGFKKTLLTSAGKKEFTWPLDYGYYKGIINPEDNEDADVFVGTGGPHHGRFHKGNMTTGQWQPDEHKWYAGLHDHEMEALKSWWATHDPNLIRDWTPLQDRAAVIADMRVMSVPKTAATGGTGATEGAISGAPQQVSFSSAPDATEPLPTPKPLKVTPIPDPPEPIEEQGQGPTIRYSGKEAAAEKVRHVVITGYSGAGKTTLAHKLALKLGLPLYDLDHDRLWRKSKVKDAPDRYDEGSKTYDRYERLRKKIVDFALSMPEPHVLEGTQFTVDPKRLKHHDVVVVDTPVDQVVKQRLERDKIQGKLDRDGEEARKEKAHTLIQGLKPELEELKKKVDPICVPASKGDEFVAAQQPVQKMALALARELTEKKAATKRISLPVIGHYTAETKIKRDAFLYQDPRTDKDFAQCKTCRMFTGSSCVALPKGNTVKADASCGLYQHGKGDAEMAGKELGVFTKAEAGYVERDVRCENCAFFDDDEGYCELFKHLNKQFPSVFDLKPEVEAKGCCNAQTPRGKKVEHKKPPKDKKDIAIDLDGTLAEYDGWKGMDNIGQPRPGMVDLVKWVAEQGHVPILWTTRGNKRVLKAWLKEHDIPIKHINENPNQPPDTSGKIIADVYVDDRVLDARVAAPELKAQLAKRVEENTE